MPLFSPQIYITTNPKSYAVKKNAEKENKNDWHNYYVNA